MKKKTLSVLSIVGILAIGGLSLFLLVSFKAKAVKSEDRVMVRTVRTRVLLPEKQVLTIVADGFLKPAQTMPIVSPLPGRVVRAVSDLKGGAAVNSGDVLLELDSARAQLAFERARTEMIRASSHFIATSGMADQSVWTVFVEKLSRSGPQNLPEMPLGNERQEILAATMGVTEAWNALKSAAMDLSDHRVIAPFSGVITGDGITAGSWVSPGESLATLMEISKLELHLSLSAEDLLNVAVGNPVRVVRTDDGSEIIAEVVRIEPALDMRSQMARVHVAINTEGESWLPGSYVMAHIQGRTYETAIRAPRMLLVDGQLPVYDNGRLSLHPAEILAYDGADAILAPDFPEGTEMVETVIENPMVGLPIQKEEDA